MNEHTRALVALHAFEHGLEVPGGLACADELRKLHLDYTLASLARIEGFLDALRAQNPPPEAVFVQAQGDANLLWLLACHVGELMGRAAGVPARWETSDAGATPPMAFRERAGCRFGPGVSARFQPLRVICARLFATGNGGLQAAFADYFSKRFRDLPMPAPAMPLAPAPVPEWPADLAGSRPTLTESDIAALRLNPPPWMPEAEKALADVFAHHANLLRRGRVVWGALIAPENALHGARYCGGAYLQVVYDPAGRIDATTLETIADRLYNEVLPDPAERAFIYSEHPRLGLAVPAEVSPWPLWMTGTYVAQNQLPDGLLSLVSLPLLIDPERPGIVAVLPARCWPAELRERWLAAGEAVHGKRHNPEDLRQQRIAELRDPEQRQSLQQDMHFQFGARHFHGADGTRDFVRARECWEAACRGGDNPQAMVALGVIHQQGLGTPIDVARARRCFQAASDLGFELGDYEMGHSYLTEGRSDMAQMYLRRAAAAGYAPAAELLRNAGAATATGNPGTERRWPRLLVAAFGCAAVAATLHLTGLASGGWVVAIGLLAVALLHLHMRRVRE